MGFFSRRQSPDMPPLVEAPKAGEPIVFDEEEQKAIDGEIQRRLDYLKHDSGGKVFPKGVTETLSRGFSADALRNVVEYTKRGYAKGVGGVSTNKLDYSHDFFTKEALEFIEKTKDRPFLLYLPYTIPHANNQAGRKGMEVPDYGI